MVQIKRHQLMDRVLLVSFFILLIFAWFDSENIIGIKMIDHQWQEAGGWDPDKNVWTIFWDQISPAVFNMWIGVLLAIGLIWYILYKDKSEALAIFVTPAILIIFGVQDLIYFAFSPDIFNATIGCWADALTPVKIISDMLGEACPSALAFLLSATVGVIIAYNVYRKLKRAKW